MFFALASPLELKICYCSRVFFCFSAAELEKDIAKVDAKIVAEEGLIETEDNRTGRYKECLEMMKGYFKTVRTRNEFIMIVFLEVTSFLHLMQD